MMVSPSASSKRARAPSNGSHNVSCLVDGCESDLSNCKDYHKRHKVCEVHAKTPKVMVEGQEQRFCQQCSRFHLLVEFDEVKRSCRKRLDGHNRRRRKPQTDSISMNSGTFFSSQQGTGFSSFINTTQMVASTMPGSNWTMTIKSGEDPHPRCDPQLHFIDRQCLIPTDISHGSEGGRQYPILQSGGDGNNPMLSNQKTVGASRCDPVHHTITRSDSSSGKVPADGLTQFIGSTDCALSLLSMPTPASSSGLTHMARADQIPVPQPLVAAGPSMGRYSHSQASSSVSSTGFSCLGVEDQRVATVLASDGSDNAGLHASRRGPLESGAHQPLPWYD